MGAHSKPSRMQSVARVAAFGGGAAAIAVATQVTPALAAEPAASAVDWSPIIQCESGGNPHAQNARSTASGLFQFVDSTWRALGGSTAHAKDASVSEQVAIANKAYARSGLTPWAASRSCWGGKVSTHAAPHAAVTASVRHVGSGGKHASGREAPASSASHKPRHAAPASGSGSYTVRSGETLGRIARAHGESWQQLYQRNKAVIGHNPNMIRPGQHLKL